MGEPMKIMVQMVALKPMTYGTRHLRAGETFQVPRSRVQFLKAIKRAKIAEIEPVAEKPRKIERVKPADVQVAKVETVEPDPLDDLRAEYETLSGRVPDRRWGAQRLKIEIDAAKAAPTQGESEEGDTE